MGGLIYVCMQILAVPTYEMKGQSSNYHRDRIPNVDSELHVESRFLTELCDKVIVF